VVDINLVNVVWGPAAATAAEAPRLLRTRPRPPLVESSLLRHLVLGALGATALGLRQAGPAYRSRFGGQQSLLVATGCRALRVPPPSRRSRSLLVPFFNILFILLFGILFYSLFNVMLCGTFLFSILFLSLFNVMPNILFHARLKCPPQRLPTPWLGALRGRRLAHLRDSLSPVPLSRSSAAVVDGAAPYFSVACVWAPPLTSRTAPGVTCSTGKWSPSCGAG
jgi:hypothetical protein